MSTLSLLDRLKLGRDALGLVTINGVQIGLRLLTEQDRQLAAMRADKMLLDAGTDLSQSNAEAFMAEQSLQLQFMAMVDPETRKPVFKNADEARNTLIKPDVEAAATAYLEFEKRFSPSAANLSEEDFTKLLEDVKKNPQTTGLNDLNSATLIRLITSLASPPTD